MRVTLCHGESVRPGYQARITPTLGKEPTPMYDDELATTGSGALLIGGYSIGLGTIVLVAIATILTGALLYRWSTRGRRYARS